MAIKKFIFQWFKTRRKMTANTAYTQILQPSILLIPGTKGSTIIKDPHGFSLTAHVGTVYTPRTIFRVVCSPAKRIFLSINPQSCSPDNWVIISKGSSPVSTAL